MGCDTIELNLVSLKFVYHLMSSSIDGCLPFLVIFHWMFLFFKAVFHCRLSSIKGCLLSKVIFHQRSYYIWCWLPCNFVFFQISSFIKDCLPSKGVFHQRLSSIKDLLSKVAIHQNLSSTVGFLQLTLSPMGGRGAESPKCFCQPKGWTWKVRHEKKLLFVCKWILGLLNVHKITYFLK